MNRKIIHIDLDAFFCAVEELDQPSLSGKPFAVGGKPSERGVVSSCSYAARQFGVCSAMPMARALRLCPNLTILPPRHKPYANASTKVMAILHRWTDIIEQISIDEAFLDISSLDENGRDIASSIQSKIYKELSLPCSIGVASNKLVAKIANDFGKASSSSHGPPMAITIVPRGQEENFLRKLPIEALWGVGPKTAEKLSEISVFTIGDLAGIQTSQLVKLFGKIGGELSLRAKGIDNRPVVTFHEPKSFSNETTFSKDTSDYHKLINTIRDLAELLSDRLLNSKRTGTTIKIKIRSADFTTITRQKTRSSPTNDEDEIFTEAKTLFDKYWERGTPTRLIGIGVSGITNTEIQLRFWDKDIYTSKMQNSKLQNVITEIQERYGEDVINLGAGSNKNKER
jgi:DNA polymerase-4